MKAILSSACGCPAFTSGDGEDESPAAQVPCARVLRACGRFGLWTRKAGLAFYRKLPRDAPSRLCPGAGTGPALGQCGRCDCNGPRKIRRLQILLS